MIAKLRQKNSIVSWPVQFCFRFRVLAQQWLPVLLGSSGRTKWMDSSTTCVVPTTQERNWRHHRWNSSVETLVLRRPRRAYETPQRIGCIEAGTIVLSSSSWVSHLYTVQMFKCMIVVACGVLKDAAMRFWTSMGKNFKGRPTKRSHSLAASNQILGATRLFQPPVFSANNKVWQITFQLPIAVSIVVTHVCCCCSASRSSCRAKPKRPNEDATPNFSVNLRMIESVLAQPGKTGSSLVIVRTEVPYFSSCVAFHTLPCLWRSESL